jgi:Domain of unknown function (DUF4832)
MIPGATTCLGLLVFTAIGAALGCTNGSGAAIHDDGGVGDGARAAGGGSDGAAGGDGGSGPGSDASGGAAGHPVVDGASDPGHATGGSGDAGSPDAGSSDAASAPGDASAATAVAVTVTLPETVEAFRNPMEGFRPSRYIGDAAFRDHEYASTNKHYIPYAALESSAADTAQKIKDWSDANWAGLRARNLKVIPRVVIVYPGTGEYWGDIPHDGTPGQWATPALKARLVAFVAKLAAAWDDDPRVAAVEMGLWGKWGEQNIYPDQIGGSDRIPVEMQKALGDAFVAAFKNKKVMVRYPNTFADYKTFGFYWDSFALPDDDNPGGGAGILMRDVWRTQMVSGEVAYDWGDQSKLGGSPNGTLSSAANTDYVLGTVARLHASSLGWIAEYTPDGAAISANAARLQKALGYRYVINKATFGAAIAAGGRLDVALTVANVGSAPFYYRWPVEVSLLDGARKVAWRATVDTADVTQWQPGGTYELKATFTPSVAAGTYTLAVAILDPAASAPALRFANTNYYRGGRTPLGRVGVGLGTAPAQDLGAFDALKPDDTLSY